MRHILAIMRRDFEHVHGNAIAVLVCMGLIVLPSLYAWFNIFSILNFQNGRLSYFENGAIVSNQWFRDKNGMKLGDTPNDAFTKGDTIFVVGSTENTIFGETSMYSNMVLRYCWVWSRKRPDTFLSMK